VCHGAGLILEPFENTVKVWSLGWSCNGGCECTLARMGGRCRCLGRGLGRTGGRFARPAWLGDGVVDGVCGSFRGTSLSRLRRRPRDRGLCRRTARDHLASWTVKRARLVISPSATPSSGHVRGNVPRIFDGYLLRLERHPAVAHLLVLCRNRLNRLA